MAIAKNQKSGGTAFNTQSIVDRGASPDHPSSLPKSTPENWALELKDLRPDIVKKAWFNMAHILLDPGAHVLDMGCGDGTLTYAMAALNPDLNFTGIDFNKSKIKKAQENYHRDNLQFKSADIGEMLFEENSLDAIINSFTLHEIYSEKNYNESIVAQTLENQYKQLKNNGTLFIRDYAIDNPEQMVLLEMHEDPSGSTQEPSQMSNADLLLYFSDQAKSGADKVNAGFPIEELPPRYPGTKLFRLPYKWAYEFIIRSEHKNRWREELAKEYTYYTQKDFTRLLGGLGTRVLYSAPHWNDNFLHEHYLKNFRLYNDERSPIGAPPTSYISVAKKLPERKSLSLEERRSAKSPSGTVHIHSMRDESTGVTIDIASRDMHTQDIIPYRIGENNRLKIFLHDGAPRPIMNTIPRNGKVLDGKRWSGHMIEAICIDIEEIEKYELSHFKDSVKFCRDYLGLKPASGRVFEEGPRFYPAPDFIDDRVETQFINVTDETKEVVPKYLTPDKQGFSETGIYREFDAQDILDAIAVGLIPLGRLEMQIMRLYKMLDIKPLTWAECPLVLKEPPADIEKKKVSATDILNLIDKTDTRFKDIKGSAGDLRVIPSVFVDQGRQKGGVAGLASREMDFVISDEKTINTAVVLPLSRDHSGEVLACLESSYLPVPQRYTGSSQVVKAPSVDLPREMTSLEDAKRFIADKFGTSIEHVAQMGEPYFSHIGMTPRRIFPFAITGQAESGKATWGTIYAPISRIYSMMFYSDDFILLETCQTMMRFCCTDSDLAPARNFRECLREARQKDVSNLSYSNPKNHDPTTQKESGKSGKKKSAARSSQSTAFSEPNPKHS
mgnify:CR=1 FL=1